MQFSYQNIESEVKAPYLQFKSYWKTGDLQTGGTFIDPADQLTEHKVIDGYVIDVYNKRSTRLYDKEQRIWKTSCASDTSIKPTHGDNPKALDCANCDHRFQKWSEVSDPCKESFHVLIQADSLEASGLKGHYFLEVSGLDDLKLLRKICNDAAKTKIPLLSKKIRISAVEEDLSDGFQQKKRYKLNFTWGSPLPESDWQDLYDFAEPFKPKLRQHLALESTPAPSKASFANQAPVINSPKPKQVEPTIFDEEIPF